MIKEIVDPVLKNGRFEPIEKVKADIISALVENGFVVEDIKVSLKATSGKVTVRRNGKIHFLDINGNA